MKQKIQIECEGTFEQHHNKRKKVMEMMSPKEKKKIRQTLKSVGLRLGRMSVVEEVA